MPPVMHAHRCLLRETRLSGLYPHSLWIRGIVGDIRPVVSQSEANSTLLPGAARPVRGLHSPDIICQTQTPAAPGAGCHSDGRCWASGLQREVNSAVVRTAAGTPRACRPPKRPRASTV